MQVSRSSPVYRLLRKLRNRANISILNLPNVRPTSYVHRTVSASKDFCAEDYVFVGPHCEIGPKTIIGRYSMLARGVAIVGGDHRVDLVGTPIQFAGRPEQLETHIGRDVWIGRNAVLMRGVTIGEGAVVGSAAVVTKDVEPYTIVAGVPAKLVGRRFTDDDRIRRHSDTINGQLIEPIFAEPREWSSR